MARPWFDCQPVDEEFFDSAPMRLRASFAIPKPADQVWADLTSENALSWCRILQRVTWTSGRPFGIGTTRTARALGGANVLKERFFRWEEGKRHSFYVVEASSPMFRRFAEDYVIEESPEPACTFTWTIAVDPRPSARVASPINRRLLETLFRDTQKHYGAIMVQNLSSTT